MKTNMIYQNDVYMRTCSATVESIILKDDHAEIVLDQTIFFPEGGGQPSDTGWLVSNIDDNSHTNNEPHAGPGSKSKEKKEQRTNRSISGSPKFMKEIKSLIIRRRLLAPPAAAICKNQKTRYLRKICRSPVTQSHA